MGSLLVAAAGVGTALVLGIVVLLLGGAYSGGLGGFVGGLGVLVGATYGGDGLVEASAGGGVVNVSLGIAVGAFPLTLTLAALSVAGVVFWRRTRLLGLSLALTLVHAVRSALLTGVLVLVVTLVLRGTWSGSAALIGSASAQLHASYVESSVFAFLLVTVVLAGTVLLRRDWLPASLARACDLVAVPVRGLVLSFGIAMVLALVGAVVVLAVDGTSDWRASIAALLAALPNVAVVGLFVGLGAGLDSAGYASLLGAGGGANATTVHVNDLASSNAAWWLLTVGAVVVVVAYALLVVQGSRSIAAARQNLLVGIGAAAVVSYVGAWAASAYVSADLGIGGASAFVGINAWLALVIGAVAGAVACGLGALVAPAVLGRAAPYRRDRRRRRTHRRRSRDRRRRSRRRRTHHRPQPPPYTPAPQPPPCTAAAEPPGPPPL